MESQGCSQCGTVLRQTGAAIGVEPGAAVRHLIEDRDACARERDAMEIELRNVRLLAMKMSCRPEQAESAAHLLRFCERAGIVGTVLREAGNKP